MASTKIQQYFCSQNKMVSQEVLLFPNKCLFRLRPQASSLIQDHSLPQLDLWEQ